MMVAAGYPPDLRRGAVKASSNLANSHHTIFPELESRPPSNCMAFNCGALNGRLVQKAELMCRTGPIAYWQQRALESENPRPANRTRATSAIRPCQYIRGQGATAIDTVDQTLCRLFADDLPVRRSSTTSKETFCPSLRLCIPARSTALMCTNTSLPPSSGWIKPKPFWPLNHFTVPCVI